MVMLAVISRQMPSEFALLSEIAAGCTQPVPGLRLGVGG